MPNALIAHPIVFPAGNYVLRVTFNLVTQNLAFAVVAGRFYWLTGDGQVDANTNGGVGDALAVLQSVINSHSEAPGCSVSMTSDFRVRVSVPAGSIRILWHHVDTTLDRTIFGFDGDTGLVTAAVGERMPRGLWVPRKPISEPDTRERRVFNGGIAETMSGLARVSDFGAAPRERTLGFRLLLRRYALDEYAEPAEPFNTFEQFWESARRGRPFRLYRNEASITSGTGFALYRTREITDPLDRDDRWRGVRWSLDLQVVRYD